MPSEAVKDMFQRRRHLILSLWRFVGCMIGVAICVGVAVGRQIGVRLAWRRSRALDVLLVKVFRPGGLLGVVDQRAVDTRARTCEVTR
jgi:hypothetical protein